MSELPQEVVIHPIEPASPDPVPVPPAKDAPIPVEEVKPSTGGLDLTDPILEVLTNPNL
ncbi:acetyl-CoA carboxylase [Trueperella pecoris]|uniref:acetyl-CoA carboxylase n=1 Tax=Trueperella pecoris TaxID=2733571 RepID=UPI00186B6C33|nr:acetyl-CoA carboxylase [Trueperella pecoris]QOQ39408.1 acetyl-CoA carboxylase [Trueperella pecoris]